MGLIFEPPCQKAIDLAKQSVPENGELDVASLLAALYHGTDLKKTLPDLAKAIEPPKLLRESPEGQVPLAGPLRPVMKGLAENNQAVTTDQLFKALIVSEEGRQYLIARGVEEKRLSEILTNLLPAPLWREMPERAAVVSALSSFGRMLTETAPPHGGVVMQESVVKSLVRTLSKMKRRNAILIGHPGTGKSAIIYELARRLFAGDKSIPPKLRDMDIFELSPAFLRSGASFVGQYDERVKTLLQVLQAHPKIILFVDEIHALFQSGVYERGPFTDANESFKGALGRGDIICIGCTTPAEFRRFIEPDKALERRFNIIRLEAPSAETTLGILKYRRPKMEEYYHPLTIPDTILEKAVTLTEEYLPSRFQPDKAIQLLDDACALCVTSESPMDIVPETALTEALQDMVGHKVMRPESLSEQAVFEHLRSRIMGQDPVLRDLSRAFVAGFSDWTSPGKPRGVFLLGGPTGVGKTETALMLARLLGHGKEMLIRVDCNTLSASGSDVSPAMHRLIGTPPGYVGYARGQGGILSRVRDMPECVVLFDEFEKTPHGVGEFLLQILDDGRVEDVDGNVLDFRRTFILFTTNVGCTYDHRQLGFERSSSARGPWADEQSIKKGLRDIGLGEEFLGRIHHYFVFTGLDQQAVPLIIARQLEAIQDLAELKGLKLIWDDGVIDFLACQWQPRFGVRFLSMILRHRITEQLSIADAQGELKGVAVIRLKVEDSTASKPDGADAAGLSTRKREGETLFIHLN